MYHTDDHKNTGFHYRCSGCNHGWFIADLQGVTSARLRGKSKEEIRGIIERQDRAKQWGSIKNYV